jgi:WD40 repeat protein
LLLQKTLVGHAATVTALALAPAYHMLVSGALDGLVLLWNLTRLEFVRPLGPLSGPVVCLAVNNLTGDIVACTRDAVSLWDLNGTLLAPCVGVARGDGPVPAPITCCTTQELSEWSNDTLLVTGHEV